VPLDHLDPAASSLLLSPISHWIMPTNHGCEAHSSLLWHDDERAQQKQLEQQQQTGAPPPGISPAASLCLESPQMAASRQHIAAAGICSIPAAHPSSQPDWRTRRQQHG
jgi:hypothetical protein